MTECGQVQNAHPVWYNILLVSSTLKLTECGPVQNAHPVWYNILLVYSFWVHVTSMKKGECKVIIESFLRSGLLRGHVTEMKSKLKVFGL